MWLEVKVEKPHQSPSERKGDMFAPSFLRDNEVNDINQDKRHNEGEDVNRNKVLQFFVDDDSTAKSDEQQLQGRKKLWLFTHY